MTESRREGHAIRDPFSLPSKLQLSLLLRQSSFVVFFFSFFSPFFIGRACTCRVAVSPFARFVEARRIQPCKWASRGLKGESRAELLSTSSPVLASRDTNLRPLGSSRIARGRVSVRGRADFFLFRVPFASRGGSYFWRFLGGLLRRRETRTAK